MFERQRCSVTSSSCDTDSYVPADSARACPRLSSPGANSYLTNMTASLRIHLSESETSCLARAARWCIESAGHATILPHIHNLHEIVMGDHVSPLSCSTGSDVLYTLIGSSK